MRRASAPDSAIWRPSTSSTGRRSKGNVCAARASEGCYIGRSAAWRTLLRSRPLRPCEDVARVRDAAVAQHHAQRLCRSGHAAASVARDPAARAAFATHRLWRARAGSAAPGFSAAWPPWCRERRVLASKRWAETRQTSRRGVYARVSCCLCCSLRMPARHVLAACLGPRPSAVHRPPRRLTACTAGRCAAWP